VDSRGYELGPVAGCCEHCDKPADSGVTELVIIYAFQRSFSNRTI
jgi:hypothetical protein